MLPRHERLKSERLRLGKSQIEFAELLGVSARSQKYYESGEREPDAAYLEVAGAAGVDVLYVVAGVRSAESLSVDEMELLRLFRAASLTGKMAAVGALNGAATAQSSAVKQKIIGGVSGQVAGRNVKNHKG